MVDNDNNFFYFSGDLWSYNPGNNQFIVSPEPDVCVIPIDITRHRCLIFGTDGLWNVLGPNSAVNVAYFIEKNNEKHYIGIPQYGKVIEYLSFVLIK